MYYKTEISYIKIKLLYIGRSNSRFTYNKEYNATYVYGTERGYKSKSLDYLLLNDGYRILPFEERRYFRWSKGQFNKLIFIVYGRPSVIKDLIYSKNPFLSLIPKNQGFSGAYLPLPIAYTDDE